MCGDRTTGRVLYMWRKDNWPRAVWVWRKDNWPCAVWVWRKENWPRAVWVWIKDNWPRAAGRRIAITSADSHSNGHVPFINFPMFAYRRLKCAFGILSFSSDMR